MFTLMMRPSMKFPSRSIIALIATISFVFAECDSKNCSPEITDFTVKNPMIKEMKVGENGNSVNTAGYMTFKNPFPYAVTIHSVTFVNEKNKISHAIELHTHILKDHIAKMEKVDVFTIPAKGELSLKPGGDHIMFMGVQHSLKAGEKVPLIVNITWSTPETTGSESKNVMFDVISMEKIAAMHSSTEGKKDCDCPHQKNH